MGPSGNRDCQWASRSFLRDFTKDALTIPAGSLLALVFAPPVHRASRRYSGPFFINQLIECKIYFSRNFYLV